MATLADSYNEENKDSTISLDGSIIAIGQSFTMVRQLVLLVMLRQREDYPKYGKTQSE